MTAGKTPSTYLEGHMNFYTAKCGDCQEIVVSHYLIFMPLVQIWHDLMVHHLIFTDAWNPKKIVIRLKNAK